MQGWEPSCLAMTGYSLPVVTRLSEILNVDPYKTFVTLILLHLNVTYEQLTWFVRPPSSVPLDESTLRKKYVSVVLKANDVHGSCADVNRRFSVRDPDFVDFSIVDGVPVFCRGPHDLYNGKTKSKYLSFQWYMMMDGCPLALTGPFYPYLMGALFVWPFFSSFFAFYGPISPGRKRK